VLTFHGIPQGEQKKPGRYVPGLRVFLLRSCYRWFFILIMYSADSPEKTTKKIINRQNSFPVSSLIHEVRGIF